jgi:hypothetical protein
MRLAALAVVALLAGAGTAGASEMRELEARKAAMAADLAETVAACVARRDTGHVAFHGCIDWHSAAHGLWALSAYTRATGDARHRPLIERLLTPEAVAAEAAYLRERPAFEMPYGRAWFLRLAIEHEKLMGQGLLLPMADEVLASLTAHFAREGVDPRSGSYDSASWALLAMRDYAAFRGDAAALERVRGWARSAFAVDGALCEPGLEDGHFMAVCANWAWLTSTVLEGEALRAWADAFFRDGLPRPVTRPRNWHHHGLNFSRAWGLHALYRATGETKYADAYVAHVRAGYDDPEKWRGSYRGVGHWVPQFGLFALQPLFGEPTATGK